VTSSSSVSSSSAGGAGTGGSPGDAGSDGDAGLDGGTTAPAVAAAAGYLVNTFTSNLAQASVDLGNTQVSGYQWYLGQFFGGAATPASDLTFNADGTLTLDGAGTQSNAGINTATPSKNTAGWVGVAFGGGAYFEARFKFNPADTIDGGGSGWPSWWAMAIEHLAQLPAQQWPGEPTSYDHFIETDFFEYDVWSFSPHNEYGGVVHDWYGIWKSTCPNNYCNVSNAGGDGTSFSNFQVQTPTATDFTQMHAFGFLWIPATATTMGSATYVFDGVATNDVVTWAQYTGQAAPPGMTPWTFGILDQQHVALILGTGPGEPITIESVNVWQASAAQNLVQQ
jgi:hypothetical protein